MCSEGLFCGIQRVQKIEIAYKKRNYGKQKIQHRYYANTVPCNRQRCNHQNRCMARGLRYGFWPLFKPYDRTPYAFGFYTPTWAQDAVSAPIPPLWLQLGKPSALFAVIYFAANVVGDKMRGRDKEENSDD